MEMLKLKTKPCLAATPGSLRLLVSTLLLSKADLLQGQRPPGSSALGQRSPLLPAAGLAGVQLPRLGRSSPVCRSRAGGHCLKKSPWPTSSHRKGAQSYGLNLPIMSMVLMGVTHFWPHHRQP